MNGDYDEIMLRLETMFTKFSNEIVFVDKTSNENNSAGKPKVTFAEMRSNQKDIETLMMFMEFGGIKTRKEENVKNYTSICVYYQKILAGYFDQIMNELKNINEISYLSNLNYIYLNFDIIIRRIEYILKGVDDVIKKTNSAKRKEQTIKEMSFDGFNKNAVFKFKNKLHEIMNAEIDKCRTNQPVNLTIMQKIIHMLISLQNVHERHEQKSDHLLCFKNMVDSMLKEISRIHSNRKETYIQKNKFAAVPYVHFADEMAKNEVEIVEKLLMNVSLETKNYVLVEVKNVLYEVYMKNVFQEIFKSIDLIEQIDTKVYVNYNKIYSLLAGDKSKQAKNILLDMYFTTIQKYIKMIMTNIDPAKLAEDPLIKITTLIEIYGNVSYFIVMTTGDNDEFLDKQFKAFSEYMDQDHANSNKMNVSFLLSKYCDNTFNGKFPEDEMEIRLKNVFILYDLISEKDIFLIYLQKLIAGRLINNPFVENYVETKFINDLKSKYGREYCRKIDNMYKDIVVSETLNETFRATRAQSKNKIDLSVKLLTPSMWPIKEDAKSQVIVPSEFQAAFKEFDDFYNENSTTKKKLICVNQYGKCTVKTHHLKTKYMVQMSTYQAFVLTLFNTKDSYSYAELTEMTGIQNDSLESALYGLVKTGILNENEKNYAINMQMKQKKVAFSCILQMPKSNKDTTTMDISKDLENERKYRTDAAIVRIMKRSKTLEHQLLMNDVVSCDQLKMFSPNITMIKDRIENLIDKEYIKRVRVNNKAAYEYIS